MGHRKNNQRRNKDKFLEVTDIICATHQNFWDTIKEVLRRESIEINVHIIKTQ